MKWFNKKKKKEIDIENTPEKWVGYEKWAEDDYKSEITTLQEAYELVLNKWEYIVNNNGSIEGLNDALPELKHLISRCGYCDYFLAKNDNKAACYNCPLNTKPKIYDDFICCMPNHPWMIWFESKTKENAEAMLDLIKKTNPSLKNNN